MIVPDSDPIIASVAKAFIFSRTAEDPGPLTGGESLAVGWGWDGHGGWNPRRVRGTVLRLVGLFGFKEAIRLDLGFWPVGASCTELLDHGCPLESHKRSWIKI